MVDSPPTYDADEVPMRKTMSIKQIRAEIFNLEGSIDWDNCDIENNYQLRWYRRLAAEGTVLGYRRCGVRRVSARVRPDHIQVLTETTCGVSVTDSRAGILTELPRRSPA